MDFKQLTSYLLFLIALAVIDLGVSLLSTWVGIGCAVGLHSGAPLITRITCAIALFPLNIVASFKEYLPPSFGRELIIPVLLIANYIFWFIIVLLVFLILKKCANQQKRP